MQSIILVCDEFVLRVVRVTKTSGCLSAAFVDLCLRNVSTESAAGKCENLLVDIAQESEKPLEESRCTGPRNTSRTRFVGSLVLTRWRNYREPRLLKTPCP